jgi:hypothetical protein
MTLEIPTAKRKALRKAVKTAVRQGQHMEFMTPRELSRLIGRLVALTPAMHMAPAMLRSLQRQLPWLPTAWHWRKPSIVLSEEAVKDLLWFRDHLRDWLCKSYTTAQQCVWHL